MPEKIWVTRNDGALTSYKDGYSNSAFIKEIHNDKSSMGKLMQSHYVNETFIKTSKGIPPTWVEWSEEKLDTDLIGEMIDLPEELPGDNRLWLTRGELSQRSHQILHSTGLSITPRGIVDKSIPDCPSKALQEIIHIIYFIIERNTTGSMKSRDKKKMSQSRKSRFDEILALYENYDNVLSVGLFSAYIEPSPALMVRAYTLASMYGIDTIHALINKLYYTLCKRQIEEIRVLDDFFDNL